MKKFLAALLAMLIVIMSVPVINGLAVLSPVLTSNDGRFGIGESINYGATVKSYLYANSDGTITRVEYTGENIVVEKYDANCSIISQQTLDMELPLWGGFYSGANYNFIVEGQQNLDEDDNAEVIRVIKYSKNWSRLGEASLFGANTGIPFKSGSLRMAEYGDMLYIRTSHQMYMTPDDGLRHQANLTFSVRESTMTVTDKQYAIANNGIGYVSHSFNQFIGIDGTKIIAADHGDAHPRGIAVFKYSGTAGNDTFISYNTAMALAMSFHGNNGANFTGVSLGGFGISDSGYLVAGNSIKQDGTQDSSSTRNIFITVTPKSDFPSGSTTTSWLTEFSGNEGVSVSVPHLVKISDTQFAVLWEEDGMLKYAFVDGSGNIIGDVHSGAGRLSDCVPIVKNNKIIWYASNQIGLNFYSIDLSSPSVVNTESSFVSGDNAQEFILNNSISLTLDMVRQDNWFKFTAPAAGDYYVESMFENYLEGYVYNENMALMMPKYSVNTPSTITLEQGQTVYIRYSPDGSLHYRTTYLTLRLDQGYMITFNANGGETSLTKLIKKQDIALTIPSDVPTRANYIFTGWNTKQNGSGTSYQPGEQYEANAEATLYAQWSGNSYTVSYNANGGTGAPGSQTGSSITVSSTKPTRSGYNFLGWSQDSAAAAADYLPGALLFPADNMTLYAVWSEASDLSVGSDETAPITYGGQIYLYKFIPDATTDYIIYSTGNTDTYVNLYNSAGTRISYNDDGGSGNNFRLEYNLSAGTTYYYGVKFYNSSLTGNIDFTLIRNYTVNYDANGGTGAPESQTKEYGTDLTLSSTVPTRDGYTFTGWNTSSDGTGTAYEAGAVYSDNADATLYAQWIDPNIVASGVFGDDNLTWVLTVDGTLTISGTGAMPNWRFSSDSPWYDFRNDITHIVINDGVTSISNYAFSNHSEMTDITIPNSVTLIGEGAFSSCSALESITLPENLTEISQNLFVHCSSLNNLVIPDGVTSIGFQAFYYCTSLESIEIPGSVTDTGRAAFGCCSALSNVILDSGVESIGSNSFYFCTGLSGITIPDTVTSIGVQAFYSCRDLESIEIPDSVTSIGVNAFAGSGLTSVDLPSSITNIASGAFSACASLAEITIRNPECTISDNQNTINPTAVIRGYEGSTAQQYANTYGRTFYAFAESVSLPESETLIIGETLTLTATVLPASAANKAVSWTSSDTTVAAVDQNGAVTAISAGTAVITATSDENAELSASCAVTVFPSAFTVHYDANGGTGAPEDQTKDFGTDLTLDSTVPEKDGYIFIAWNTAADGSGDSYSPGGVYSADEAVTLYAQWRAPQIIASGSCGDNLSWTLDEAGTLTISGTGEMTDPYGWHSYMGDIQNVVINEGATNICAHAFEMGQFETIELPSTLTEIGNYAFSYSDIESIDIPDSVERIGANAFEHCDLLSDITIGSGLKSIGNYAFYQCYSLSEINLPAGFEEIGLEAFSLCRNFYVITVDENNENFTCVDGVLFSKDMTELVLCPPCRISGSYTVPSSVTKIGDSAFDSCSGITGIILPDGLTSIGSHAFFNCTRLETIDLPDSLTEIKRRAFYSTGLTTITIPQGITKLEEDTFAACYWLDSVVLPDTITEICDGAFNTDFRMRSINLPCSLTSIDNGAFNYCRSLTAYGYYGSYAYQFAEETGLSFVCLPAELVDSNTNVSVSGQKLQGDATLVVSSANSHISKYIKREKVLEAYDVYLEKDGQNVQPGDTVTVKLPAPEGAEASACRVYSIDTVGRYIDMNAEYEDGYLTFTADRLNTYFAITTGQPIDAFVFKVDDYNAYWATYDQLFEVDVPCQFVGGSTYVPFRVIAQAAGAESVSYDPNAATVTLVNSLGMTVVLKIDSTDCTVTYGGQTFETTVNAAPTFIDGAVCLPVRDVANVTFSNVEYMNYFGEGYVFVSPNKLSQDDIEEVIWCYISKIIN